MHADYSGSLVLQLPIAEACHVALQLHPPASHQQQQPPRPGLRIVSFGEAWAQRAWGVRRRGGRPVLRPSPPQADPPVCHAQMPPTGVQRFIWTFKTW